MTNKWRPKDWKEFDLFNLEFSPLNRLGFYLKQKITHSASKGGIDKDRNGTPYDERMGALENGKPCLTCLKTNQFCDGHFGHIVLPIPVYNKMFLDAVLKVLQCICPRCCKCRMLPEHVEMQRFSQI